MLMNERNAAQSSSDFSKTVYFEIIEAIVYSFARVFSVYNYPIKYSPTKFLNSNKAFG